MVYFLCKTCEDVEYVSDFVEAMSHNHNGEIEVLTKVTRTEITNVKVKIDGKEVKCDQLFLFEKG